jgi:hypothetical protein
MIASHEEYLQLAELRSGVDWNFLSSLIFRLAICQYLYELFQLSRWQCWNKDNCETQQFQETVLGGHIARRL